MRARVAGFAIAGLAVAILVSGCAERTAGAAAIVGDDRISERQLEEEVQEVLSAQGQPVGTESSEVIASVLNRLVTESLIDQLAVQEGVDVTEAQVDTTIDIYAEAFGGEQAIEDALVQQGIAPSQVRRVVRTNVLAESIGAALDPQGTPESRASAVYEAVVELSVAEGTTISPRYGTWDSQMLLIGPIPDDLSNPGS